MVARFSSPSIIALRARRKALHLARQIAYPEIKPAPPMTAFPVSEDYPSWRARLARSCYPLSVVDVPAPPGPAPRWMKWIAIAGVVVIGATWLLAMSAVGLSVLK